MSLAENLTRTLRAVTVILLIALSSCGTLRDSPKYQLSDDVYHYREKNGKYQKAWVYVKDDSISILSYKDQTQILISKNYNDQFFLKKSFDVDVMTVGFKYRPATVNLPRQLTTDFNGNVFLGYRLDRFKVQHKQTPLGIRKNYSHRGITAGFFGGIGSTAVTPWTTTNLITDEYNGFILSRGVAAMVGINSLTVGVGVGWDAITDRDKSIWIYQNKPWYGLTVGLNLN
jgi:hypothetical protein